MSKESGGFLRKVARFVANPTTDWAALDTPSADSPESEYAKTEIKAMIERKRRNDFVRKRELDMLRKIRREGLSQDNALAMAGSASLDSESRPHTDPRSDIAVVDKIAAIEQQMVGDQESRRQPAISSTARQSVTPPPPISPAVAYAPTEPNPLPPVERPPLEFDAPAIPSSPVATASAAPLKAAPSGAPLTAPLAPTGFSDGLGIEVCEMEHDPELDEAVIAFANAEFDECERALLALIAPDGSRHSSSDTWMVVFDLYRALDLPQKFDQLAVSFAHQFGLSAPQWYSLPERIAQAKARSEATKAKIVMPTPEDAAGPATEPGEGANGVEVAVVEGWLAPNHIDANVVSSLRGELLQLPRPWTMDWTGVEYVSADGAAQLAQLMKQWSGETIEMAWIGNDHLHAILGDSAPTGARDADPAYWMLRLEMLRLTNRPDQFDEVAIDYCVTYEMSPPSWEAATCKVKLKDDGITTQSVSLSRISEITTSFVESQIMNEPAMVQVAALELSGQLVGDISDTLTQLDGQLGASVMLDIDCENLLRVDFIAAGDLLNWVLNRRAENRQVVFIKPHRLVALFFGAMGINEHARVKLLMT